MEAVSLFQKIGAWIETIYLILRHGQRCADEILDQQIRAEKRKMRILKKRISRKRAR